MLPYSALQTKWRKSLAQGATPSGKKRIDSAGLFISSWLTLGTGGASLLRYFCDCCELLCGGARL